MKKVLIVVGVILLVLVVAVAGVYRWASSEGFLRKHVLPRISEQVGHPIEAESIEFSLLRSIEVKGLVIGEQADPIVRVPELRVRYNLMDILFRDTLRIEECTLVDAELTLRQTDARDVETTESSKPSPDAGEQGEGGPANIFIENVNIQNLALHFISEGENVVRRVDIQDASFSLPLLQNGRDFELTFGAALEATENGQTQFAGRADVSINGHLGPQASRGRIDSLTATIQHQERELIALRIAEPITISQSGFEGAGDGAEVPVTFTVSDFDVQDWLALVPESAGLEAATGVINLESQVGIDPNGQTLVGAVSLRVDDLSFQMDDGTALKPVSIVAESDMRASSEGPLDAQALSFQVLRADTALLDVQGTATLHAPGRDEKSTLRLESQLPVNVDQIMALYTAGEDAEPEEEGGDMPWIEVTLIVPKVSYEKIVVTDAKLVAELKGKSVSIQPSSLNLAGGAVSFEGTLDTAAESPAYTMQARINDLPIGPFMQTFLSAPPIQLAGGLQSASLTAEGKGFSKDEILKSLDAAMDFQVDQLEVERMQGLAATVVDALLLTQFGISRDQLSFADGQGAVAFRNGVLNIKNLDLSGGSLGLSADGTLALLDAMQPDLRLTFRFPGAIGRRLSSQGLKLTKGEGGAYVAPTLELKGQFWMKQNLAKLALQYGAKTGKLDSRLGEAAGALDALQNLQGKDGQPADPAAAVEGVLNLMEGVRGNQDKDVAPDGDAQDTEKDNGGEKTKEDQAKDAIRGILGL